MSDPSSDFSKLPEERANDLGRFGIGLLGLLFVLLILTLIYVVGEKAAGFEWQNLKRGLLTFGLLVLAISVVLLLMTWVIRAVHTFWPNALDHRLQKLRLKSARRTAVDAISKKQQLNEERARLTAQLQATYLFEKETGAAANAKASQEFRAALQASVTRSCEIAFDHITKVVQQYERVLAEIDGSDLPPSDKADLMNQLTTQLELTATKDRNLQAQQLMENQIWKVRFRKARLLMEKNAEAAMRYIQTIRSEAKGTRLKERLSDLMAEAEQAKA